jgi:iron complex outermembrane receptor protein
MTPRAPNFPFPRHAPLLITALLVLPALLSAQTESTPADSPTVMLEAFKVTSDRLAASDQEGAQSLDRYDPQQIDDTGAFTLNEFLETLPGAGSDEEVLVLIDGEPAYIDPSTLPIGMVEGIDVARDGSMPEYGAQSGGRVINIRLKKDYQGAEAGLKFDGSFAGGGEQQTVRLSSSIARGKWRTLFAINASHRSALDATDRTFARNQDHTSWGGSDLRLAWGSPAVIRAVNGPLNGLTDTNGNPVNTALVPENQTGSSTSLAPGNFLPGGPEASGQRRFDTSPYRQLISPSQQLGATFSTSYPIFGERLRASLSGSFTHSESKRLGPPPVSSASSRTRVPGAYNPFGQDIQVGLVHTEFGPTRQQSATDRAQLGLKLNGKLSPDWSWNGGIAYRRDNSAQTATDLDPAALAASLASADPANRFNPFGDPAAGPVNAHLYPSLTFNRQSDTRRNNTRFDLAANGTLTETWAGPLTLSMQGGYQLDDRTRTSRGAPGTSSPESHYESQAQNASTSLNIPLAGRRNQIPFLNRLETRLSARYSSQDDGSEGTGADLGLVWSPIRPLLFRARHAEQSSLPSPDVSDRRETLVNETVLDPRRDLAATEAQIVVRDIAQFGREKSTRQSFGATFEPPFAKGLRLSGAYQNQQRENLIQRRFDPQDVINNESAFPGRVIRAAPTADELAEGRPGTILSVDTTPGNTGRSERSSLDLNLEYALPSQKIGRIRFSGTAERNLTDTREISPGVAFINDGGGRSSRPDWEFTGTASWNFKAWMASLRLDHTGEIAPTTRGEGVPAQSLVTLNTGWRFRQKISPKRSVQYRLGFGIGNLFDEEPPRADTIAGYRGGSPLGRTYTVSLSASL